MQEVPGMLAGGHRVFIASPSLEGQRRRTGIIVNSRVAGLVSDVACADRDLLAVDVRLMGRHVRMIAAHFENSLNRINYEQQIERLDFLCSSLPKGAQLVIGGGTLMIL